MTEAEKIAWTQKNIKEPGVLADYLWTMVAEETVSIGTAYNYYLMLRLLAKFLKHHRANMDCEPDEVIMAKVSPREMLSITEEEWDAFMDYCTFDKKEAAGTIAVRISVTRGFYHWLGAETHTKPPCFVMEEKRPIQPDRDARKVSVKLEEKLIEQLRGDHAVRNACILRLFLRSGLTLGEILSLDVEDVDLKAIHIGRRGGEHERVIPIDKETGDAISEYLAVRLPPTCGGNPLFVSAKKGRLRRGAVQKMLRRATRSGAPGLKNVSIRDLQHTAKLRILDRAPDVETAMKTLPIQSPYYLREAYAARARRDATMP